MEKYAVDLDKVLDDFEYNEEQAVRPSQYLRSELPAKKYQRPPFQRINIEDADFSPSKQTSSPVISYTSPQVASARTTTSNGTEREQCRKELEKNINVDIAPAEEVLSVPDLLENDKVSEDSLVSLKLPDVTETVATEGGEPERRTCDLIAYNTEPVSLALEAEESHTENSRSISRREDSAYENNLEGEIENERCAIERVSNVFEVLEDYVPKGDNSFLLHERANVSMEKESSDGIVRKENNEEKRQQDIDAPNGDLFENENGFNIEKDENGNEASSLNEEVRRLSFNDVVAERDSAEINQPSVNENFADREEKDVRKSSINEAITGREYNNIRQSSVNDVITEKDFKEVRKSSINETINAKDYRASSVSETVTAKQYNDYRRMSMNETGTAKEEMRKWSVNEGVIAKECIEFRNSCRNDFKNESNERKKLSVASTKECNGSKRFAINETAAAKYSNEIERLTMKGSGAANESVNENITANDYNEEMSCQADRAESKDNRMNEDVTKKVNRNLSISANVENNEVNKDVVKIEETIEPVQFVTDIDIPDEDLEKYLEELEVEEETLEQTLENKDLVEADASSGVEERPQRPKSLDLSVSADPGETGSAGSTPCPKEVEREDRDNKINEIVEVEEVSSAVEEEVPSSPTNNASPPSPPESPTCPLTLEERRLGKVSPFWVPDADALNCMNCGLKFTMIKRRHHCRGCGRVLCGKCCDMRASLEYLGNQQHRVCEPCFRTLTKVMLYEAESDSEADVSPRRQPNPNNPMEYCSTVPPPLQASPSGSQPPPSVLVPVLKREGSSKNKEPHQKKVMFSDGIRPGGDLTSLDEPPLPRSQKGPHGVKRVGTPPGSVVPSPIRLLPPIDPTTQSFIINNGMPPVCEVVKGRTTYHEPWPFDKLMERLRVANQPPLLFAVSRHLIVSLKIVQLNCCMMKSCWVFSTRGMSTVGQDEMMVLLQMQGDENDEPIPVDVFLQLHCIYQAADKGDVIKELGYWSVKQATFLDSRQHGGFLFVRPTFQCVQNIDKPSPPYLVAVLIHRLELPWARLFPLRLMLRLGAEFRYYPCSLVSVRNREPVYFEIGQTIINLLADFRNYSYTLPEVQGLRIHMEAQQTSVLLPKNRYDQVVAALNNSNEPVLPFAGTFSPEADSHLVCMQSKGDEITYHTHAINIHDKPRKVTGTSFVVFNASLKSTVGVQAKSHMVEDGVMVQVSSDTMAQLRSKLRAMENWSVKCGPNNEEVIQVVWADEDKDFNRGVRSVIDGMPMDGVPSIRVHNGTDYMCSSRFIRWTQVFIIKCEDGATSAKIGDPLELNRLAEAISRATCTALTKAKLLDHLAIEGITTLALRATVTQEQVCYEAGGNELKLEPTYMNYLDNELIPVLHKASATNSDSSAILELVFHILDQ